jgi:hypothetical protein
MVPHAQDANSLGGKAASAFLGSDQQSRTGLIKLSHGDTGTVASSGPFTWTAQCTEDGGGNTGLTVTVDTTEADSITRDFSSPGGQPLSPGSPATVFANSAAGPAYSIAFPLSALAPSGAAPVGLAFAGIGVLGTDCVIDGVLWPLTIAPIVGYGVTMAERVRTEERSRRAGQNTMIPGRERRRFKAESILMRLVATAGIVALGVVLGASLVSADVAGWTVGLVVALVSVVLAGVLWSSRQL